MVLRKSLFIIAILCGHGTLAQEMPFQNLIVVPIERLAIPARVSGTVESISVKEGDLAAPGQPIVKIDDSQAKIEAARAMETWKVSQQLADSSLAIQDAETKLARAEQLVRKQRLAQQISERKALSMLSVDAAKLAEKIAANELERAKEARRTFVDSVSQSEIDNLTYSLGRASLESEQAVLDRQISEWEANAEKEATADAELGLEQARGQLAQSKLDQQILQLKAAIARRDADLAQLLLDRHQLNAPFQGVVTRRLCHVGQWVDAGQPMIEIVSLDRLRAETFVPSARASQLRAAGQFRWTLRFPSLIAEGKVVQREATVAFVSPDVDPVNGEVRVWFEFDNAAGDVFPGMRAEASALP